MAGAGDSFTERRKLEHLCSQPNLCTTRAFGASPFFEYTPAAPRAMVRGLRNFSHCILPHNRSSHWSTAISQTLVHAGFMSLMRALIPSLMLTMPLSSAP